MIKNDREAIWISYCVPPEKEVIPFKMPLSITMTQGFVVFLAFCYFACLFLAFFILYLIFESWQSEGPDDEGQIEDAIRAGPFAAQSNWLPKSMAYVSYSSNDNNAKPQLQLQSVHNHKHHHHHQNNG